MTTNLASKTPGRASASIEEHLDLLFLKARDDEALVNRLIGYECRVESGLTRGEAIRRANERWIRDFGR